MDKKGLKNVAGRIALETKLSNSLKIKILNFLKTEATEAQMKAYIMDKKLVKLDEQAESVVNDRFKQFIIKESKKIKDKKSKK